MIMIALSSVGQIKKTNVPSYFGIQVRPVFPTRFIGTPEVTSEQNGFQFTMSQKMGYSFGAIVRVGLTKTLAIETGINKTRRNFDISLAVPDSSIAENTTMGFEEFDIPINSLFYVQLSEQWFMNASLGFLLTYKPSETEVVVQPGGLHRFQFIGLRNGIFDVDANANIGFEFRTEKAGIFYLGGSGRVPFSPLMDMVARYNYQGITTQIVEPIDGSFLSIDFKYFFPNIKNKGEQFKPGPIE